MHRLIFFLTIGLFSCTKELDFSIDTSDHQYVVNCFITEGKGVSLALSQTYSIMETVAPAPPVDALILIAGTTNLDLVDTLFHQGGYIYRNDSVEIRAGEMYFLDVYVNEVHLHSQTMVPAKPVTPIASLQSPAGYDEYGDPITEYQIEINDAVGRDYYELFLFSLSSNKRSISFVSNDLLDKNDPAIIAEGLEDYANTTFLFSDQLFDGKRYEMKLRALNAGYSSTEPPRFVDSLTGGNTYVLLRALSPEYYIYRSSWVRHRYHQQLKPELLNGDPILDDFTSFLFKANVQPFESNIENGLGVFAGYNERFEVVVEEQ